jgi:DNA invertase Pin-like site-specific DNA recombinase
MVRTTILLAILTHKENPISKMIISILGIVAEMERKQIKERQREGIELAKLRGVYTRKDSRFQGGSSDFSFQTQNCKNN